MTSRFPQNEGIQKDPEVRAYVKRLLTAIFLGLVCVVAAAVWAWKNYGGRIAEHPGFPPHKAPQRIDLPEHDNRAQPAP